MKGAITLGIGILIGRYIYLNYDKEARLQEAQVKKRLYQILEELGFTKREIQQQSQRIFRN